MTEKTAAEDAATANGESKPVHVMDLLKQFDFLSIGLGGKIRCALTGRDLPLRVDAIQQHVNSKKLKKEKEWYKADFSKYEPLIVPHKTNPKLLYCTLTQMELNRIPQEVERHVNGKRFLNRKQEMEGLKQSQRAPAGGSSDEEFWALGAHDALEADEEEGEEDGVEDDDESDSEAEEEMAEASTEREGRQRGKKSGKQKQFTEQKHVRLDKGRGKGKVVGKGKAEGRSGGHKSASLPGDSGNRVSIAKSTDKDGRNEAKKVGGKQNAQKGSPNPGAMRTGHAVPVGDTNESKANGAAPPSIEDEPRENAKSRRQSKGKTGKGTPTNGSAAEETGKRETIVEAAQPAEKRKLNGANVSRYSGKKKRKA